jgi:transposase InsO family protein
MEVVTRNPINTLRTDNGSEYFNNGFEEWLKKKRINRESNTPKTHII